LDFGMKKLLKSVHQRDTKALAQLLTWIESAGPGALAQRELTDISQPAYRIGITGPPGAGKSSLVSGLIAHLRGKGLRIAVLAVDPSSPFTGGAILGDRIRYSDHATDPGVFIRSVGTRGGLGGLSASAYLMLRAFDLARFDVVLIETVGVGQTELEVVNVADCVTVVLVPESGDSIQAMKAGLVEIADLFVVNKADRPGAESFRQELNSILHLEGERPREVFLTVATTRTGVAALADHLLERRPKDLVDRRTSPTRIQQEALALLRAATEDQLRRRVRSLRTPSQLRALFARRSGR
jgi:LAO/AO transport system kinase